MDSDRLKRARMAVEFGEGYEAQFNVRQSVTVQDGRALLDRIAELEAALTELELAATLSLSDVPGDIDYVRLSKACQAARAALDEA